MDSDNLTVSINSDKDVDTSINTLEEVNYERYNRDSYITFYDDGENAATFSITDLDDLLTAVEHIKAHHDRLEAQKR